MEQPSFDFDSDRLPRRTLRQRLTAGFLVVALLPFATIAIILAISGAQTGRQQTISQLETILSYKESSIQVWLDALQAELGNLLSSETNTSLATQQIQSLALAENPSDGQLIGVRDTIRGRFQLHLGQSQYYDELFIVARNGLVAVSSNSAREGQNVAEAVYFQEGLLANYIAAPTYNDAALRTEIYVAYPIVITGAGLGRQAVGVLVGRARITPLNNILSDTSGLPAGAQIFLVGQAPGSAPTILAGVEREATGVRLQSPAALAALQSSAQQGSATFSDQDVQGQPVIGIVRQSSPLQASIIAQHSALEATRANMITLAVNASVAVSSILVALFMALLITRSVAQPLDDLSAAAEQIAHLEKLPENQPIQLINVELREIATLGRVFNEMWRQIVSLIGNLEQRVAERTQEIAIRSNYLQASSEVSQATASIVDPEELIKRAVELICERFNLYYVGLFLADDERQWALLRAGSGEAGRAMIQRGHRLPIGRASMIGWSIANAQARIAQVAAEDIVRQANPFLPDTRSEVAIPLRTRRQAIGALTVQSTQPNAFDQTLLDVLQSMADQLAAAIENARLISGAQTSIQHIGESASYAAQSQLAWSDWLESQSDLTYQATSGGIKRLNQSWLPQMQQAYRQGKTITGAVDVDDDMPDLPSSGDGQESPSQAEETAVSIPVNIRGTTVGVIHIKRPGMNWSGEEIELVESISEQLGAALDSARLYAETQLRAEQERLISQVASRMQASMDVESVLRTAIDEIFEALNQADDPLDHVEILLAPTEQSDGRLADQQEGGVLHV
jgi:GAF domain-containing protein